MPSQIRHTCASAPRPQPGRSTTKIVAMVLVAVASVFGVLIGDASVAPPADAACSISTNLGLGSRGDAVRCLQTTLNALGYNSGPVDGSFGAVTYRAVQTFQRAKGLKVDGLVGRITGSALGIWGTSSGATGGGTGSGTAGGGPCKVNTTLRRG